MDHVECKGVESPGLERLIFYFIKPVGSALREVFLEILYEFHEGYI